MGTANETLQLAPESMNDRYEAPEPTYQNPNLTDSDRDRIRADRAAAAEARLKKQNLGVKKPKKKDIPPLRGPNTEPAMRWNVGN